jgi:hypothetical protein
MVHSIVRQVMRVQGDFGYFSYSRTLLMKRLDMHTGPLDSLFPCPPSTFTHFHHAPFTLFHMLVFNIDTQPFLTNPIYVCSSHFLGSVCPFPISRRWGRKPDGICIVVGTLASNFEHNTTGDVIVTTSDSEMHKKPRVDK